MNGIELPVAPRRNLLLASWRAGALALFVATVTGCASVHTETRQTKDTTTVYRPQDASAYERLDVSWTQTTNDARGANFAILQLSQSDEYKQERIISEQRTVMPGGFQRDPFLGTFIIVSSPVMVPFCVIASSCEVGQLYGGLIENNTDWYQASTENSGEPIPTGRSEVRPIPLQCTHPGTLTVIGYDAQGKGVGKLSRAYEFSATNTIDLAALVQKFSSRPQTLSVVGTFPGPRGSEKIELSADASAVAQFDFGEYAWMSAEEIRQAKLAAELKREQEQLQAQIAEAQAAQAAAQREIDEAREQERQAREAARQQARQEKDNAMFNFVAGAAVGSYVGRKGGDAELASAAATVLGVDADAAAQGANAAVERRQRAQEQAEQLQQKQAELNAKIAAQQERQREIAANADRRRAEIAEAQQRQQQKLAMLDQQKEERRRLEEKRKEEQGRQPREQQEKARATREKTKQFKTATDCVYVKKVGGKDFLANRCTYKINVSWADEGNCAGSKCLWAIGPETYTSAGDGVKGRFEYMACADPGSPKGTFRQFTCE